MSKSVELCNQMFQDFVYHSLLYYSLDTNEISDTEFDLLSMNLLNVWDTVTHPDKHLLSLDDLQCGSGYNLTDSWPRWAIDRALTAGHEHWYLDQYRQTDSTT